jgi:hypothetical protein
VDKTTLEMVKSLYIAHLKATEATFNDEAERVGLPVRLDATAAIEALKSGVGLAKVTNFFQHADDVGIVHEPQLRTAINCVRELLKDKRCGHVVGAMQSGKTTTSLALQWAGPIIYMLTGQRPFPLYIIGNQTNHEDQTTELDRFLVYYGNLELKLIEKPKHDLDLDAVFLASPSLNSYREHVLHDTLKDTYAVPQLADIIHRRVGGKAIKIIADLCQRAQEKGYKPLMVIDEPQFGASDRLVVSDAGGTERRACVLQQIFDAIEEELDTTYEYHWFVGLSATPFELNDLARIWEVRQTLTPAYSGFNFFNGEAISPGVNVTPPNTLDLTTFASNVNVRFMASVSMAAYANEIGFRRYSKKIGYMGTHEEYQAEVERALRAAIVAQLNVYRADAAGPVVGMCIRAFNDNNKTNSLIDKLGFNPQEVEIIKYYGDTAAQVSVKRLVAQRKNPKLPYIIFVTNRARMADAFPAEVRFFLDFAQRASDLNALLQGLLGRACGYNKKSTVVLSDENASIVAAYVATNGGYVHRPSRHSVAVGGYRRGAPTGMLKLTRELGEQDPLVKQFFKDVDAQVVAALLKPSLKPKVPRAKNNEPRRGPIVAIATKLGLFDHIEQAAVRPKLFPEIPTGFQVVRKGEYANHTRDAAKALTYSFDEKGENCRFTFRWSERGEAARGGAAGRAKGKRDSVQHIEPTIYIEKYDPKTGETINDNRVAPQVVGAWRAFMVTFPLKVPVQEVRKATVALPTETAVYDTYMTDEERALRDGHVAANA